jgi:hypothetical protein
MNVIIILETVILRNVIGHDDTGQEFSKRDKRCLNHTYSSEVVMEERLCDFGNAEERVFSSLIKNLYLYQLDWVCGWYLVRAC